LSEQVNGLKWAQIYEMLKACIGLKQIDYIDRRHCGLPGIPEDVYRHERTLEELLLDFNTIGDLPPVSSGGGS
jgi:protein scribble